MSGEMTSFGSWKVDEIHAIDVVYGLSNGLERMIDRIDCDAVML